jgi:uncharacterized protein YjiS (DUF1127 family)
MIEDTWRSVPVRDGRVAAMLGGRRPLGLVRSVLRPLWLALERGRQRRILSELDDDRLRDIGLTRIQVRQECVKPFWR